MFGGPAKTTGFHTEGMTFSTLRKTLAWQKTDKGLSDDAQLRSTGKKGLYAKDGVSNKGFSILGYHFSGPLIERGNKFLNARDDVARSINLSYGNLMHEGQLIGDYVIDQLLTERAEQESADASENGVADPEDVKRRKGNMTLRYRDLETLQTKIDAVKTKIKQDNTYLLAGEGRHEELVSSVGYMRGRQSPEAVRAGTEALIQSLADDFLAHEKITYKADFFNSNFDLLTKQARRDAIEVLNMIGMEVRKTDDGKEEFHLPGGLTPQNAGRAVNRLVYNGIKCSSNTRALFTLAKLPQQINARGDALLELDKKLHALGSKCNDSAERVALEFNLRDEGYSREEAVKVGKQLIKIEDDVHKLVEKNRDIVRELKSLSYPGDLFDTEKRAEIYGRLANSLKEMDQLLSGLDALCSQHNIATTSEEIGKAASDLFDTAQDFCIETLSLAADIYPETSSQNAAAPKPSDIRLPGLNAHWDRAHYDNIVEEGLSYKAEAPDILFQADATNENKLNRRIEEHNKRIEYLKSYKEPYLKLKFGAPENISGDLKSSYRSYQENLNRAIRHNDLIVESISRRQKILGIGANKEIEKQLKAAKKQHDALMLLLHPNLAPTLAAPPDNGPTFTQQVDRILDQAPDGKNATPENNNAMAKQHGPAENAAMMIEVLEEFGFL